MPLGVPKIPQQYFEDEDAVWIDLYNRRYEERLLLLNNKINLLKKKKGTEAPINYGYNQKSRLYGRVSLWN